MAESTILKRALRQIAGALTDFARHEGWRDEDYQIHYRIDPQWDRVHIILVAHGFEGHGEFENYSKVRSYLESRFKDEPELIHHLGLVVRSMKQVQKGGIYAIGPEFRDYWAMAHR